MKSNIIIYFINNGYDNINCANMFCFIICECDFRDARVCAFWIYV